MTVVLIPESPRWRMKQGQRQKAEQVLARFGHEDPAREAAGKALFWDAQAGSDNKTSCASCHFQAGADTRNRNQLNPGPTIVNLGDPNLELAPAHFPISPRL